MGKIFKFEVSAKHPKLKARVGKMVTPHGIVNTPVYMPVGTQASVKALDPVDLKSVGAEIILGNTYHLYLRPGEKLIKEFGGLAAFMKWDGPTLTDSGGYQVTSLQRGTTLNRTQNYADEISEDQRNDQRESALHLVKIDDDGVTFRSHWDGSLHRFTPEKAIQIQKDLGSDIIMAFDEATPLNASYEYTKKVLDRTHRWAVRSLEEFKVQSVKFKVNDGQALFGIIQGGFYQDLRRESAQFISSQSFDGIAVGGGDIGSDLKKTGQIFEWIADLLPADKPIYAMGVGVYPQDIVDIMAMGVDMFDCVAPTRIARSGLLYSGELKKKDQWFTFESPYTKGRLTITKAEFVKDKKPIDENCGCYTCQAYTRAYLHHLFRVHELLAYRLGSIHNLYFMINLVRQLKEAILNKKS